MESLAFEHLTVYYHHEAVLLDVSVCIPVGKKVAIVGPNGAGKTTLLKAAMGLVEPLSGRALCFGLPYHKVRAKVAYVSQKQSIDTEFPITALEVVLMGRFHALGLFKWVRDADRKAALDAMKALGIDHLASRNLCELSGGQQQRVFIARALAQDAELYLLDEPFAAIDAATEALLIKLFDELQKKGKTIVVVHHDLSTVASIYDEVILLNHRLISYGAPKEALKGEFIAKAYGKKEEIFAKLITELSKKTTGAKC